MLLKEEIFGNGNLKLGLNFSFLMHDIKK